jgi:GNAT superfamily N-acetyltransferase
MPAMLDDPNSPTIYRTSGTAPFPDPHDTQPSLPVDVYPRVVTLRDRVTIATIVPFSSQNQVPPSLLAYLSDQLNKEIDMGDTYPMIDTMPGEKFSSYWFQNFGAVMLLGNIESADEVVEGKDWATECLGSFYIKPNYPGRSSHVCNAGFLVTDAARNKGVGRLMGESYLDWAPRLGYTYSVFNLVYETNVASCRIWDALGFKRIGRVKGAGNLKSYPGRLIDAIIYGRDLGPEGADFVSDERFDKIAFYLRFGKYPAGADRAEKSRLRSAATHYKLLNNDKLVMMNGKEVIADPQKQYEIAKNVHGSHHGGINKTTATIAEKYHWVRIKETATLVIKNCVECKELGKTPAVRSDGVTSRRPATHSAQANGNATGRILPPPHLTSELQADVYQDQNQHEHQLQHQHPHPHQNQHHHQTSVSPQVLNRSLPGSSDPPPQLQHLNSPITQIHPHQRNLQNDYMPIDPHLMEDVHNHLGGYNSSSHPQDDSHDPHHDADHDHESPNFNSHHHDEGGDDSFQAMLGGNSGGNGDGNGDLDMLIDHEEEGLPR